jgi:hypothetical protein
MPRGFARIHPHHKLLCQLVYSTHDLPDTLKISGCRVGRKDAFGLGDDGNLPQKNHLDAIQAKAL